MTYMSYSIQYDIFYQLVLLSYTSHIGKPVVNALVVLMVMSLATHHTRGMQV